MFCFPILNLAYRVHFKELRSGVGYTHLEVLGHLDLNPTVLSCNECFDPVLVRSRGMQHLGINVSVMVIRPAI